MDCVTLSQRNTFWTLDVAEEECNPRRVRAWTSPALESSCGAWECNESNSEDRSTEGGDSLSEKSSEVDCDSCCDTLPVLPHGRFAAPPGVFTAPKPKFDTSDTRTTLLLKNLPSAFRLTELMQIMQDLGLARHLDFVYVPTHFKTGAGLGYAFINATNSIQAQLLKAELGGFSQWQDPACRKVLEVIWSAPHQGLDVLVAKYRNSRVMHPSVPESYKPAVFKNAARVPFPPPTKRIRCPV